MDIEILKNQVIIMKALLSLVSINSGVVTELNEQIRFTEMRILSLG